MPRMDDSCIFSVWDIHCDTKDGGLPLSTVWGMMAKASMETAFFSPLSATSLNLGQAPHYDLR